MPGTGSIAPEPSATAPRPRAARRAPRCAAGAGVDVPTLWRRRGRTSTVRALGAEIRLAFQSRSFAEGVRAALDDLIRVLETGSTTQDLLAEIARYITRASQQPDLPCPGAAWRG